MPEPTSSPLLRDILARALHATREAGYTRWSPDQARADAVLAVMRSDPELHKVLVDFLDVYPEPYLPEMADALFGKPFELPE